MEDITVVGPEREEVDVKEESEVLPDGTVHSTQRVSHHKVKHVRHTHAAQGGQEVVYEADEEVPGSGKEDVYEMFEHPAKLMQESNEIEQTLDDGRKVKKHVVMNRMVHLVKMHHESFDEEHHKLEEDDYEIEEVVPGTESAFVAGLDSDYEEEAEDNDKKKRDKQKMSGSGSGMSSGPDESNLNGGAASPKLVTYIHGSDVDDINQFRHHGRGETTLEVVEDMLAKGQLTLDDPQEGEVMGAEAPAEGGFTDHDDDKLSSSSSDAAQLEDVEDGAAGPEDRSIVDEDYSGDDIEGSGVQPGDDDVYTHRVVMKKEVHQKTMIRADGQEETVIREDSQVHQDSEPPEALRHSMEQIIHHFLEDNPQVPSLPGEEEGRDDGTEV